MRRLPFILPVVLLITVFGVMAQIGGGFTIVTSTIDGGGGTSLTGTGFTLSGTIGQHDAGAASTGGGFTLTGGFWPGVAASMAGDAPDLAEVAASCPINFWPGNLDAWTAPNDPTDLVRSAFSIPNALMSGSILDLNADGVDDTFLDALQYGADGGAQLLLREAVAALLNAAHPDIDFALADFEVLLDTNTALAGGEAAMLAQANAFAELNNGFCVLA